jgi:hypothetical protein
MKRFRILISLKFMAIGLTLAAAHGNSRTVVTADISGFRRPFAAGSHRRRCCRGNAVNTLFFMLPPFLSLAVAADCPFGGPRICRLSRSVKNARRVKQMWEFADACGTFSALVLDREDTLQPQIPASYIDNVSIIYCSAHRGMRAAGEGTGIHQPGQRPVHGEAVELGRVHDRTPQL